MRLKMTVRFTRTMLLALASASASALLFTGTANADRQNAAPIVFGEQSGAPATQTYQTQPSAVSSAPSAAVQANPKSKRLEFRYPDQPDVYYGNQGPRSAQATDAPMAFSSSTAAIGRQQARQYAALPEPVMPEPAYKKDPAITSGGFDARAAAARVTEQRTATPQPIRVTAMAPAVAQPVGRPLTLSRVNANQDATMSEESGKAGVYADGFEGRPTANGEIFEGSAMTAAHPTLPLPSLVQVINQSNGREIVVRVNDRGPFAGGRIMDLSEHAADMLGIHGNQTANVRVRYLGPAPVKQVPQVAASRAVQEEALAPFAAAPVQTVEYTQPNLGVADPVQAMQPAPVKAANGNVFIQAGSFADIGNAQRLTSALGRQLPVEIQEARVRNADYFRVMIGPFQTRQQAEVYRAHLRQSGITDGLIVAQ